MSICILCVPEYEVISTFVETFHGVPLLSRCAHRHSTVPCPSVAMPTILAWVFDGGDDDSDASDRMQARAQRRGERQRVHSGDDVEDDVLGVGKIEKIDGGYMTIIFGSGQTPPKYEYTVKVEVDND